MSQEIPFIGREEELAQIKNLIEEQGTRRVLSVLGLGGIGKTRLLTEIQQQYASHESWLIPDIIDFDDRALHLSGNIERQIAQKLGESSFELYLGEWQDLRKMEAAGVSQEALKRQSTKVHQVFIENFNHVSSSRRIVLLLDTAEKLENEEVWAHLTDFIFAAKNVLFVLAGRPDNNWWEPLHIQLDEEAKLTELQPLDEKDGQQYLKQKQDSLHITLEPDLQPKLLLLAGGRPILLDLAVEWLARDHPRDWLTDQSLEELESLSSGEMKQIQHDFEFELVHHITKIRGSIDKLILMMSRIYPLSSTMIAKLLKVSENQADRLFNNAQTYVFVKLLPDGRITLHDEMRRMVEEYVWPDAYSFARQRRDSRIAAKLFEEENQRLKARLAERETGDLGGLFERAALVRDRDIIHQQWIEHALYSAPESGFVVWKRIVDERRAEKEFRFANSLIELAEPYYQQFYPDQQFTFDMLKVRLTNDTGQVRQAENMLHKLLQKNINNRQRKADIYNVLGQVEAKLGLLKDARDHQIECLNIVRDTNRKFITPVATLVGYYHRLLGEPAEAEKYYKLALKSSDKSNKRLIAGLLNNLGYVYGLQMRYSEMEFYCRQAKQIWLKVGADREIGRAEETMAIFSKVRGNYNKAIVLLQRAISRYEEPDDHYQLCTAFFELGWTQLYQSERINEEAADIRLLDWNEEQLKKAKQSAEKSQKLAERYGLEALLPRIWYLNAFVHWYLGRMHKDKSHLNKAREFNAASYEKSKQVGDIRYAISSLLADAEWDYEIEKYEKMEDYAQELAKYEQEGYRYPLFFGRMCRIEADIAFAKKDYERAFSKYAQGLPMIHEHGGYSRYTIERELLRLENKMNQNLSPTLFDKWAEYLHLQWTNIDSQDTELLKSWTESKFYVVN